MLNVLVPLLSVDGAAINVEVDLTVLNLHKGDVRRIAWPNGRPPQGKELLQFLTVRPDRTISQAQAFRAHRKGGLRVNNLSFENPDDLKTRLLRHMGRVGIDRWSGGKCLRGL